ncbi:MAG: type II secretion system F family protein [archaeon]
MGEEDIERKLAGERRAERLSITRQFSTLFSDMRTKGILDKYVKSAGINFPKRGNLSMLLFKIAVYICLALTLGVLAYASVYGNDVIQVLLFLAGVWTVVLLFIYVLCWIALYAFVDIMLLIQKIRQRKLMQPGSDAKVITADERRMRKEEARMIRRATLLSFLEKAGLGQLSMKNLSVLIFKISIFVCLSISGVIIVYAAVRNTDFRSIFLFLGGIWTAVFVLILGLIWLGFFVMVDLRIYQRTQEIEAVLPDFLQLAAANISSGMTIDRALWFAVRPRFGILAKEIEDVAKSTMTGEDLGAALSRFSQKYDSKTLKRSINLLLEGISAGGEMADLLNKISIDIQETRIMQKEMAANIMSYVIFIGFASIIAAPFMLGLSTQLIIVIKSVMGNISVESLSNAQMMFSLVPDAVKVADFKLFSLTVLFVTTAFSMAIIGTIRYGSARRMLPYIPVMYLVTIAIYYTTLGIFGTMMGSLL